MHYAVYVGLVLAVAFGVVGPAVARRVPPATGARLLSVGGLLSAAAASTALGLLAALLIGQNSEVALEGHWSVAALHRADPVRWPVAIAACIALTWSVVGAARFALLRYRVVTSGRRALAPLTAAGDLIVLADARADTYAMPGPPGRVIVTTGMLALLDPEQWSAVLAHERAHLRRHHHLHRTAVGWAAAMNPLLRPLIEGQRWATERWADEEASAATDRWVTAVALAKAAGAAKVSSRPCSALAVAECAVDRRIAALLAGPPRRRPWLVAATALLVVLALIATTEAILDTAVIFHAAGMLHAHLPSLRLRHAASRGLHLVRR